MTEHADEEYQMFLQEKFEFDEDEEAMRLEMEERVLGKILEKFDGVIVE